MSTNESNPDAVRCAVIVLLYLYLWLNYQSVDEALGALEELLRKQKNDVLLGAVEELLGMLRSASHIRDILEKVWKLWPETRDFDDDAVHKAFGACDTFGGITRNSEFLVCSTFPEGESGEWNAEKVINHLINQGNPPALVYLVCWYLATTLTQDDIRDFYTKRFLPRGVKTYWWWWPVTSGTVQEMLIVFYAIKYSLHCWIAARAKLAENRVDEVAKIVAELNDQLKLRIGGTGEEGFAMLPEEVRKFFEALPQSEYTIRT